VDEDRDVTYSAEQDTHRIAEANGRSPLVPPSSRSSWLATILRERLVTRGYRPGEWIREAPLQAEFSLSNGPVREALQSLVADGLLERVPYRGVRVRLLSDEDVLDLFELRLAMIELAAEYVISRRAAKTEATAIALIDHIEGFRAQKAPRLDGALTRWLLESACNSRLAEAFRQIEAQAQIYVNEAASRGETLETLVDHATAFIKAVVDEDRTRSSVAGRALTRTQLSALGIIMRLDTGQQ
jgi:DNA-binding GntR family transcriptional regulator